MPYATIKDVPAHLRHFGLAGANKWGSIFDALKREGHSEDSAAAIATTQLKAMHKGVRLAMLRFLPLAKAAQLGLFGGGGPKQDVHVTTHVAKNPGGVGVHLVTEHKRAVEKAVEAEKAGPGTRITEDMVRAEAARARAAVEHLAPEPAATSAEPVEAEAVTTEPEALPGVPAVEVEQAQDVSNLTIARGNLEMIRAKATALGLEVVEAPATADDVLRSWGTTAEEFEFDPDVRDRAKARASELVHLTITAPKHTERIVGTVERIEGELPYFREFGERGAAWSPERVRDFAFTTCADCGRKIERKFAYLVQKPGEGVRQVGGQCAANLNLPAKFAAMMAAFEELAAYIKSRSEGDDDGEGGGGGGGVGDLIDPVEAFRVSLAALESRGFHSAKAYRAAQDEGRAGQTPTAWTARGYFATRRAIAKGHRVSPEDRETYEKMRSAMPRIAPLAAKLHAAALTEAEEKAQAPDAGAMETNAVTALKTGSKKLMGFSTFAAWKQLQDWRRSQATHPPKPYARETVADKLALPIETLRDDLGGDDKVMKAIEKVKAGGKAPKYLTERLETYVPGTWRVEDIKSFDTDFGTTHKVRLRRDADGAGMEWSTGEPRGRMHGVAPEAMDWGAVAKDKYDHLGLPTDVSRNLSVGDHVKVLSAADYAGPRARTDDERTPEERAESAKKSTERMQRMAVTRMTRLNTARVPPPWTADQHAAAEAYRASVMAYGASSEAHHAARDVRAKRRNELEAEHRQARDARMAAVSAAPEVIAANAAAEPARKAESAAAAASSAAYYAWRAARHNTPEQAQLKVAYDAAEAAAEPVRKAREAADATYQAAREAVAAKLPPVHDPKAEIEALNTQDREADSARTGAAAEHAKNVEARREQAIERGIYPAHLDDHVFRKLVEQHGTAKTLQKGSRGVRLLMRMLIKGGQINLLTGKDEQGAGTKRVRVKAHTRIVDGKAEVVQAHERLVEVKPMHLPGPTKSPHTAISTRQPTGADSIEGIAERASEADAQRRAKRSGSMQGERAGASIAAKTAAMFKKSADPDGVTLRFTIGGMAQSELGIRSEVIDDNDDPDEVEAIRSLKGDALVVPIDRLDAVARGLGNLADGCEDIAKEFHVSADEKRRNTAAAKGLHALSSQLSDKARQIRHAAVPDAIRMAIDEGRTIDAWKAAQVAGWDQQRFTEYHKLRAAERHTAQLAGKSDPTMAPPQATVRDRLVAELRELSAKAVAARDALPPTAHAARAVLNKVIVDETVLNNPRRDVATLKDWHESLTKALHKGLPMGLKPVQPSPSAVPPSSRVRYRHPETGEQRDGRVHAGGEKGITVVDEDDGQAHKVPHGHYVVHPDEDGSPAAKAKQAARDKAAEEAAKAKPEDDPRAVAQQKHDDENTHGKLRQLAHELPSALKEARADLRMGVSSRAAQAAASALFFAQAGQALRKVGDLKFEGKAVTCHGATVEDPALAAYLAALVKDRKPGEDVIDNAEQRACDYLNGHVGDVEVTPDDLKQLAATDKWTAAAGKLPKVKDDADHAEHIKKAARDADVHPKDVDPVSLAAHRKGVRRKGSSSLAEHLDAVHKSDPNDMRRAAPKETA